MNVGWRLGGCSLYIEEIIGEDAITLTVNIPIIGKLDPSPEGGVFDVIQSHSSEVFFDYTQLLWLILYSGIALQSSETFLKQISQHAPNITIKINMG